MWDGPAQTLLVWVFCPENYCTQSLKQIANRWLVEEQYPTMHLLWNPQAHSVNDSYELPSLMIAYNILTGYVWKFCLKIALWEWWSLFSYTIWVQSKVCHLSFDGPNSNFTYCLCIWTIGSCWFYSTYLTILGIQYQSVKFWSKIYTFLPLISIVPK